MDVTPKILAKVSMANEFAVKPSKWKCLTADECLNLGTAEAAHALAVAADATEAAREVATVDAVEADLDREAAIADARAREATRDVIDARGLHQDPGHDPDPEDAVALDLEATAEAVRAATVDKRAPNTLITDKLFIGA